MIKKLVSLAFVALLSMPAAAFAVDYVWATEAIEGTRWKDGGAVVGKAESGKRLELLFEDGDKVRVRIEGSKFGWVELAKVSKTDPAAADTDTDAPAPE